MLLNFWQRGTHCLLRCCFCWVALSSLAIEILFAITAIAVMTVYNLSVLGRFLYDTEVRFACNAKLPVLNDDAFISQSSKSSPLVEIGEASIHNYLYFWLIDMHSSDMSGQVLHRKRAVWAAAVFSFVRHNRSVTFNIIRFAMLPFILVHSQRCQC